MAIEAKKISWWDMLRLQVFVSAPSFLWGLVAPNRLGVSLLCRLNAGPKIFSGLREKYGSDHLWSWFPMHSTLLVLDPDSIDAVLQSNENAPDPVLKVRALSKFVPEGLIISNGDDWHDRRRFNEEVLDFGHLHRDCDAFGEIVRHEVDQLTDQPLRALYWADFQELATKISHQVLLGAGHLDPTIAAQLAKMIRRSNLFLRHRRAFAAFYQAIAHYLARHRALVGRPGAELQGGGQTTPTHCLVHRSAELLESGEATDSTRVPSQIGFWAFVLKDAVELHVARTLALIAAHPAVQDRVRREILSVPVMTAQAIDGMRFLEACVREQLRLWTPVPILLRRARTDFALRGRIPIKAEQQILIHTGFYHRDPGVFGGIADQFSPESVDERFPPIYYFSLHQRSCAGQFLARFLVQATLASLLAKRRFELVAPRIEPQRIPYLYNHFKIELRAVQDA